MVWQKGDCDLLQETDRLLTDDEANNFKVADKHRGTIEEIKKRAKSRTKESKENNQSNR